MIPEDIKREHILAAIERIDSQGVPETRQSTKFDLLHKGKVYPPKYVISLSHLFVNGEEWSRDMFSGGGETNHFLAKRGFTIVEKHITETEAITQELEHRKRLWNTLSEKTNENNLADPHLL